MNLLAESNNKIKRFTLNSQVKTLMPIFSNYRNKTIYIPKDTVLEVSEVYGVVGVDVLYEDIPVFVYSYEIELV